MNGTARKTTLKDLWRRLYGRVVDGAIVLAAAAGVYGVYATTAAYRQSFADMVDWVEYRIASQEHRHDVELRQVRDELDRISVDPEPPLIRPED